MLLLAFIFVAACAFIGGVIIGAKISTVPAELDPKPEPLIAPSDFWAPKTTKRKSKGKRKGK